MAPIADIMSRTDSIDTQTQNNQFHLPVPQPWTYTPPSLTCMSITNAEPKPG
jgi:hypothetical protein